MYNDTDFQYWQGRESQDITLEFNFKIYEMSKQSQSLNLLRATESFDLSETQIFFLKGNLVWYNYLTFLLQIFTAELHHLPPIQCHRHIKSLQYWDIRIVKSESYKRSTKLCRAVIPSLRW